MWANKKGKAVRYGNEFKRWLNEKRLVLMKLYYL